MKRKEKCKMECMGHLLAGVGIPFSDNEEIICWVTCPTITYLIGLPQWHTKLFVDDLESSW
jgi:hypothetical protein